MRTTSIVIALTAALLAACTSGKSEAHEADDHPGRADETAPAPSSPSPSSPSPAKTATDAAPAAITQPDAAPATHLDPAAPIDNPYDEDNRIGKKTGLGTDGEAPEIATEALLAAIADGSFAAERLVDPSRATYELVSQPGAMEKPAPDKLEQHCGADSVALLVDYAKTMQRHKVEGFDATNPDQSDYPIACNNSWMNGNHEFRGLPGRFPYAECRSDTAAEWGSNYDLYFVPDQTRGVRFAGVLVTESGGNTSEAAAKISKRIAKPAACK